MTFRQVLGVIWQRRLLVVAVVVIAVAAAGAFVFRQTPTFVSTITTRLSSLAVDANTSGQIGTASVDFDLSSITSPAVLDGAAVLAHEPPASTGSWQVSYTQGQGTQSNLVTIRAVGTTSQSAQTHATSVARSYNKYLQAQTAKARGVAEKQASEATAQAETYQAQVNRDGSNAIAAANLGAALKALSNANGTIESIDNAPPPLTITSAATPGAFTGVSPVVAIGVALLAGLVAGLGIALIWDQFDDRLRDEQEIEKVAGVPALGELSLDKRVARRGDILPAAGRKRTALNEGLRSLRTTLQVLLPHDRSMVVVTSVEPGDGKTFISSNLAIAWARTGKSVILVGGDLRKAALDTYFGEAADGPGLTELLQTAVVQGHPPTIEVVERRLSPTDFRGLRVLPSGAEPFDPADLLATSALHDVFSALRELSDIVIVDSPPSVSLVDSSLLAAEADGAVLVASIRRTNRARLAETVQTLASNGVIVLGVIANRSRRRIPRSYAAYYGRSVDQPRRDRHATSPAADTRGSGRVGFAGNARHPKNGNESPLRKHYEITHEPVDGGEVSAENDSA